jgi:hypothetical protein
MKNLGPKLDVILVDSKLNDDDMRNRLELEESNIDPTNCFIVPRPSKKTKLSSSSSKVDLVSPPLVLLSSVNINSTKYEST